MDLARPYLQFDGHAGGGQLLGRLLCVVQEDLATGHMDQGGWQSRLDVVKRLVERVAIDVGVAVRCGAGDQAVEGVECSGRKHRIRARVGVSRLRFCNQLQQR